MKLKYGLFAFDSDYPAGGLEDMKFAFNDLEEIEQYLCKHGTLNYDFLELVEFDTLNKHDLNKVDILESIRSIVLR